MLSSKTNYAYRLDLNQYKMHSNDLNRGSFYSYIEKLNKRYTPKSAKRKIASLNAFVHFLFIRDINEYNPFGKIEIMIKKPYMIPHTLSTNDISTLIKYEYTAIHYAETNYKFQIEIRKQLLLN